MEILLYMLLIIDTKIYRSKEAAEDRILDYMVMVESADTDIDSVQFKIRYRNAPDGLVKSILQQINYIVPSSPEQVDDVIGMDRKMAFEIENEPKSQTIHIKDTNISTVKITPRDEKQQKQVQSAYEEYKVARDTAQTPEGKGYFRRMFEAILKLIRRK